MTDRPITPADELLIVTDDKGFVTLHEPNEDGEPGDLVASVWRGDYLPLLTRPSPVVDGPTASPDDIAKVMSYKWLDPECCEGGCQSLVWKGRYESAVKGRADFRTALRDKRAALAMRPAPETTASDDVVEALTRHCSMALRSGYPRTAGHGRIEVPVTSVFIDCSCGQEIEGSDEHEVRTLWAVHALTNLPKPTEQATSPAPDAVLREAIDWFHRNADGLKSDIALAHRSRGNGCTEWMREDDRDFRRDLDKHLAALASSKPTGERERV